MLKLKQGTAAVALVVSLGLIVPSSFGGPASADISHNPNRDQTPFTLHCDLNGDSNADTEYVASHYEVTYDFVQIENKREGSKSFHDLESKTVMTHSERIDVLQAEYEALTAVPAGYPVHFIDTTVEWFDEFFAGDVYPHGKPKGRKTVRCVNISDPYEFTVPADEAALDQEQQVAADVTYDETDWQLFEVVLTAKRPRR
jgi:hypothetical protein